MAGRAKNEADRRIVERGATALRVGDLAAAERLCREVLTRLPTDSEALNVLGAVAFSRREFIEADRLFSLATTHDPANMAAWFNLGKVLEVERRFEEAANVYSRILLTTPKNAEPRVRLGIVRYEQGRHDEAVAIFENLLQREPQNKLAALSLGVALNALGRYEDAVRVLRALLEFEPELIDAYHALADSLYELHRADESAEAASAALARNGSDPQALVLLGQAEAERGSYLKAERLFKQAAAFAPERHEPQMNLGVLLQRLGRLDEALAHGARAVELAPEDPLAHFNFGMGLLLSGTFSRGWSELEWRLLDRRMREHFPYRDLLPLWDGRPLDGGELLIAREQGAGDFILHSRFFARARERGVKTLVEVPAELAELYAGFAGIDDLAVDRAAPERLQSVAAHTPLCSLPFVLGIDAAISAEVPYVHAPAARAAEFAENFAALGSRRKVGIAWAGSARHQLDRYRSVALEHFAALWDLEGIAWVSLQKGEAREQLAAWRGAGALVDLDAELRNFADTAAAISQLDLVIAVDTAVAHLAGALGKPVWMLSGFGAYWVWQLERADSPWYPTMRIFRQRRPNDWDGLFADLRAALQEELEANA